MRYMPLAKWPRSSWRLRQGKILQYMSNKALFSSKFIFSPGHISYKNCTFDYLLWIKEHNFVFSSLSLFLCFFGKMEEDQSPWNASSPSPNGDVLTFFFFFLGNIPIRWWQGKGMKTSVFPWRAWNNRMLKLLAGFKVLLQHSSHFWILHCGKRQSWWSHAQFTAIFTRILWKNKFHEYFAVTTIRSCSL